MSDIYSFIKEQLIAKKFKEVDDRFEYSAIKCSSPQMIVINGQQIQQPQKNIDCKYIICISDGCWLDEENGEFALLECSLYIDNELSFQDTINIYPNEDDVLESIINQFLSL